MRLLLIPVASLVIATPAAARDHEPPPVGKLGEALSNPMVQEGVAQAVTNVADALLATRIGPLARYTDPDDDIRPDDTLGDLEARRDPDYRRRLHDSTRKSVAVAGQAARDAGAMAGELQVSAARLKAALAPLVAALGTFSTDAADDRE